MKRSFPLFLIVLFVDNFIQCDEITTISDETTTIDQDNVDFSTTVEPNTSVENEKPKEKTTTVTTSTTTEHPILQICESEGTVSINLHCPPNV